MKAPQIILWGYFLFIAAPILRVTADCKTLDPSWSNVVTNPALPVKDGDVIALSCEDGFTKGGSNMAICEDGQIFPKFYQYPPKCAAALRILVHGVESDALTKFQSEILSAHNLKRAKHWAPPLKWNSTLAKLAQDWANHLVEKGLFAYRPQNGEFRIGENIYDGWYSPVDGAAKRAVDDWYGDIINYDFHNPRNHRGVIGHFTQVVWRSTTDLGCGIAHKQEKGMRLEVCVVCEYFPAGNWHGEYAANVH